MKKALSIIFLLLFVSPLLADTVSSDKALEIAKTVLGGHPSIRSNVPHPSISVVQDEDLFIVNREGGGFVLVAANDDVRQVLGFSYDNNFVTEEMPDNVRFFLDYIKGYCRSGGKGVRAALNQNLITGEFLSNRTVEWNQRDPANLLCPNDASLGGQTVCGCLPLAMAEILTWFGYPEKGNGTLPSYQIGNTGYTINGYTLNTRYNWAGLQGLQTSSMFYNCQEPLRSNLAQLVYDCGVMLTAQYYAKGTEANHSDVPVAFSQYMGYSKAARKIDIEEYSPSTWNSILEAEVEKHPVLYCGYYYNGSSASDGHAYVLDGYATYNGTERVFHFNMGWGGFANGYYFPSYQDTENGNPFNAGFDAIIDFEPDPNGTSDYFHEIGYFNSYEDKGIDLVSGSLKPGSRCTVYLRQFGNLAPAHFTGEIGLVLQDKNGVIKQLIPVNNTIDLDYNHGYSYYSITFTVDAGITIELGDHLSAVYKADGDTDYHLFKYSDLSSVIGHYPAIPASFITKKSSYSVGDLFILSICNNDYRYSDATWKVIFPSGATYSFDQSDREFILTQAGRYKIEVQTSKENIVTYINVQ